MYVVDTREIRKMLQEAKERSDRRAVELLESILRAEIFVEVQKPCS